MNRDTLDIIRERKSTRDVFDYRQPVTGDELNKILEAARWTPTAHNMQNFELIVVDDKKLLERIAGITYPMTKAFIRENAEHISTTEEEWRKRKTGILSVQVPPALREAKDSVDDEALGRLNTWWGRAIPTSAFLVLIVYDPSRRAPDSENDFLGVMSLGCLLQNVWLMATALGIDFQAVSALGNPLVDKEIREILEIPPNLGVALAFRIGHTETDSGDHVTVRRDIEDFTYYNGYGRRYEP
jgi:nitroreductase